MSLRIWMGVAVAVAFCAAVPAQVIEFESGGLKYQTMSRHGITVMFAHLPLHVREYAIVQVAVSNGSDRPCTTSPEDVTYRRNDGTQFHGTPAKTVVNRLLERAGRNEVIRLINTYEMGLYGIARFRSTSGYEQRRQAAQAELTSTRLKAAAAASAIALVETKLTPGQSTDGAVFFTTLGKPLGDGRLIVQIGGERFEFESAGESPLP